jgi:hypothetical protein
LSRTDGLREGVRNHAAQRLFCHRRNTSCRREDPESLGRRLCGPGRRRHRTYRRTTANFLQVSSALPDLHNTAGFVAAMLSDGDVKAARRIFRLCSCCSSLVVPRLPTSVQAVYMHCSEYRDLCVRVCRPLPKKNFRSGIGGDIGEAATMFGETLAYLQLRADGPPRQEQEPANWEDFSQHNDGGT